MSSKNKNLFNALLIALLCVAITLFVVSMSLVYIPVFDIKFMDDAFVAAMVMSAVIPFSQSFPVSYVLLQQKTKIARLNAELKASKDELDRSNRKLFHQSSRDDLTGLLNRRYFMKALAQQRRDSDRGGLLYIDIDHFKTINDTYGHDAGDVALRLIAKCIERSVRHGDVAARLGGEEFAVYVVGAGQGDIGAVAEKLRASIARIAFSPHKHSVHALTASIGAAGRQPGETIAQLLKRADQALYIAKKAGRNQVIVAPPPIRASAVPTSHPGAGGDTIPELIASTHDEAVTRQRQPSHPPA